jgi:phasin family protein
MSNTPNFEQLAAAQKANSVSNANTLLAAKDAKDVSALNQQLAKPGVDKMMDYSRKVYDLVAQMQKEVTAVVESQYSQFQKDANTAISKTQAAPVGGDVFAAAMKTMLDQTNKAFEGMNAVARQMSELAESNLQSATAVTAKTVGAATKSAAKK